MQMVSCRFSHVLPTKLGMVGSAQLTQWRWSNQRQRCEICCLNLCLQAYERSYPVANYQRNDCGIAHIIVGCVGNDEGLSNVAGWVDQVSVVAQHAAGHQLGVSWWGQDCTSLVQVTCTSSSADQQHGG
jgi:hypothetical protein